MKALLTIVAIALIPVLLLGCNRGAGDKERIYDIKGTVVSVDAEKKSVRLNHEDIPGHMAAMEMGFTVSDAKLLEGLKAGNLVQGKLTVKDGASLITELHKR